MSLVDLVDNGLLNAAEKAVGAWGDYTGGSKYGLARLVNWTAPIAPLAAGVYFAGQGNYEDAGISAAFSGLVALVSFPTEVFIRRRKKIEEESGKSANASEAAVLNPMEYSMQSTNKSLRLVELLGFSMMTFQAPLFYAADHSLGAIATATTTGVAMITAASYIVSVGSGTPKGGKLVRAFEAVKSRIPKLSVRKPAPQPG